VPADEEEERGEAEQDQVDELVVDGDRHVRYEEQTHDRDRTERPMVAKDRV
jgi:hypothetical protein